MAVLGSPAVRREPKDRPAPSQLANRKENAMQEWRDDIIVSSVPLPEDAPTLLDKLAKSIERMSVGEIDHVRIGRIPEVGEAIEVNGLQFTVKHSQDSTFTADLFVPTVAEDK